MTSSQPSNPESIASIKGIYRKLPKGIWVLGFVSMFMDISSELVHSLLPIFMATVLGASMVTIGIVEGVAEGAAAITKVFSGAISDYFGKRKFLALAGKRHRGVIMERFRRLGYIYCRSIVRGSRSYGVAPLPS